MFFLLFQWFGRIFFITLYLNVMLVCGKMLIKIALPTRSILTHLATKYVLIQVATFLIKFATFF
ncbi:MAG: hypothetical protein EBU36_05400 [Verrucomicrobia bacterium]|nr:hypothetical protein [Verrucomicrobiota bacterium]